MEKKFDLKKIPKRFYDGLSPLFHKLGINGNDVIDDFIYSYIDYAHKHLSQKRTDIYTSTGFGRKFVNNYFNKIKLKSNPQIAENHKTLIGALQVLFDKSQTGVIKIRGKENSFNSAFNLVRLPYNNISAQAMLNKFIRVGILEKIDDQYIKLLSTLPKAGLNDPDDAIRVLVDTMNRLCRTILHNISIKKQGNSLVQRSYWSNAINPKDYQYCIDELSEETRKYLKNCSIIIDKFEKKGLSKEEAETKNTELGVSAFIFRNIK